MENWGIKIPWLSHFTWWICGSSGIWFQISQVVRYYQKRKTRRWENRNVHILLTFSVCTLALSTYSVICSEEKSGWRWFCVPQLIPFLRTWSCGSQTGKTSEISVCAGKADWGPSWPKRALETRFTTWLTGRVLSSKWWATPTSEGSGRSRSTQQSWVQSTNEYSTAMIFVQLEFFTLERELLWGSEATNTSI